MMEIPSRRDLAIGVLAAVALPTTEAAALPPRGEVYCSGCRFFQPSKWAHPNGDSNTIFGSDGTPLKHGECRRYAPGAPSRQPVYYAYREGDGVKRVVGTIEHSADNSTWSDYWCGEWESA